MAKRVDRNQVFDSQGNLVSEQVVEVVEYPTADQSAAAVAKMVAAEKVRSGVLSDVEVEAVSGLYDELELGLSVTAGEVYRWDGTLVEVLQGHVTQADWTPDVTPALWKVHRTNPVTDYPVWVQPDSTNPYNATWDDGTGPVVVRFPDANGDLYVNTHGDGNVWSPADYGWALYTP